MSPLKWASPVALRGTKGVSTRLEFPFMVPVVSHKRDRLFVGKQRPRALARTDRVGDCPVVIASLAEMVGKLSQVRLDIA
jgi:hypothetical protein